MAQVILLFLSLYAIVVGYKGNGRAMLDMAGKDVKGFAPWAIAITMLGILSVNKYTEELGKPFAILFAISVILKNFGAIQSNSKQFYNEVMK
jgi:hypothetical protein